MNTLMQHIDEAAVSLNHFLGGVKPRCALILGSGLNFYADTLKDRKALPYSEVPHLASSTVPGHVGQFVLGRVEQSDTWILCMQGRLHSYEGLTSQQVAFPVWVMNKVGIETLITTNAAGALNPEFKIGSFCVMKDHINFTGRNPLVSKETNEIAPRFVPMLDAYDPQLRELLLTCANKQAVDVVSGVYLGLLGPSFETPAEVRLFASWGADTVAMSVVEEVIAARHVDMRVVGLSLISNMGCGIEGSNPTDEEVREVAQTVSDDFARLMNVFLPLA